MPNISTDQKAIQLARAFAADGHNISKVIVEGKRIEVVLANGAGSSIYDPDLIDWKRKPK